MLYRGQAYGDPVGEWWTDSLHDAEQIAMSRHRNYVILSLDEDDTSWLARFRFAEADGARGNWFQIPEHELAQRWHRVTISSGSVRLDKER